jgi:hypothetical protein
MRVAAAFGTTYRSNESLLLDDEGTPFHSPAHSQYPHGHAIRKSARNLDRVAWSCGKLVGESRIRAADDTLGGQRPDCTPILQPGTLPRALTLPLVRKPGSGQIRSLSRIRRCPQARAPRSGPESRAGPVLCRNKQRTFCASAFLRRVCRCADTAIALPENLLTGARADKDAERSLFCRRKRISTSNARHIPPGPSSRSSRKVQSTVSSMAKTCLRFHGLCYVHNDYSIICTIFSRRQLLITAQADIVSCLLS